MLSTFADITDSQKSFGFHPTTDLRTGLWVWLITVCGQLWAWLVASNDLTGIKLFVQWYKDYHRGKMTSPLKQDNGETYSDLDVTLLNKEIDRTNMIFHQRVDQLRSKCVSCEPM